MSALRDELGSLALDLDSVTRDVEPDALPLLEAARGALSTASAAVNAAVLHRRKRTDARQALDEARARVDEVVRRCERVRARAAEVRRVTEAVLGHTAQVEGHESAEVVLESDVPEEHPRKREVEGAVRQAVATCPGRWTVRLQSNMCVSYWSLSIRGTGVNLMTLLDGESEQSARFVKTHVLTLMRVAQLSQQLSAIPRRQR